MDDKVVREAVIRLLESRGYRVESIAAGQGVPKNSRVEIEKAGRKQVCAIKVSEGGRISFTRNQDGSYKVLSHAELVIYAKPAGADRVSISAFSSKTVLEAFEANYRALVEHEREHIPSWVNPEFEGGWRLSGSGFGKDALWTATAPLGEQSDASNETVSSSIPGIMERIKSMLSEHMGVPAASIEVDVRVKT